MKVQSEYINYRQLLRKEKRRKGDPQSPDVYEACSTNSFAVQVTYLIRWLENWAILDLNHSIFLTKLTLTLVITLTLILNQTLALSLSPTLTHTLNPTPNPKFNTVTETKQNNYHLWGGSILHVDPELCRPSFLSTLS